MDIFGSFKCVACLLKTLKILHCVKKAVCAGIICVIIAVAVTALAENKTDVKKLVRQIKKKVM